MILSNIVICFEEALIDIICQVVIEHEPTEANHALKTHDTLEQLSMISCLQKSSLLLRKHQDRRGVVPGILVRRNINSNLHNFHSD